MKLLRIFTINMSILCATAASACVWSVPERWYMYEFSTADFTKRFSDENYRFWNRYCDTGHENWWVSTDDMLKSAEKKNDAPMVEYLHALDGYLNVSNKYAFDDWEYPTAQELAQKRAKIKELHDLAARHQSGPLSDRWLLLLMRTNLLSKNYDENIGLWETKGSKVPAGYVKEMMHNIYANALLNKGRKIDAWNIYADQNDNQSLLWSVRKYTNLAGIKDIYNLYPDAPVHKYLLKQYVNTLQEAVDYHYDKLHRQIEDAEQHDDGTFADYVKEVYGNAYAQISDDYMTEIKDFVAFANQVANEGRTDNPCMWETAAALCAYYIGDYAKARGMIDSAMAMKADSDTNCMARRIRMLIYTSSDDISSPEFKKFIVGELRWLDSRIDAGGGMEWKNARDRILNLGLTKNYDERNCKDLALLMAVCRDYVRCDKDYVTGTMTADIYPHSSDYIKKLYDMLDNPGDDPLRQYVASKIVLSDDFRNDILGTKYLQEGKWAQAIPVLEKVDKAYLEKQPIAFYAARRDYNIPAWQGHQSVGDNNYEEMQKPVHLTRNAKVGFCRDMIRLIAEYDTAAQHEKELAALKLAVALYQASRFGQCWYLSQYGFTQYETYPVLDSELAGKAIGYLRECSGSSDPGIKAQALFGLAYAAPGPWITFGYEWNGNEYRDTVSVDKKSQQYAALLQLTDLLKTTPSAATTDISRCDVLKMFRRYSK